MIAGLNVASEVVIPAATPSYNDSIAETDVTIRYGEKPCSLRHAKFRNRWVEAGEQEFILRPKIGLAFTIRNGSEITVSRAPDISDSEVRLYLVGSAWGVLCHQRRLLPLHCSAVEFADMAVGFSGPSRAGKSTLAAGLSKRGYPHLCDDVCIADPSGDRVRILPLPKGLKLWRDAAEALEMARGAAVGCDAQTDKYYVSVPKYTEPGSIEVSNLYVLTNGKENEPNISRLRGSHQFEAVLSSLYRHEWLMLVRDPADVFKQVAELAGKLKVFRFSRPRDMSGFDHGLNVLEAHICKTGPPAQSRRR